MFYTILHHLQNYTLPVMDKINEREPFISVTFVNINVYMFLHMHLVQRTGNNKYAI